MRSSHIKNLQIPVWGLFIISTMSALYLAKAILVPICLAVMASFLLTPAVRMLRKLRIPDAVGSALILGVITSVLFMAFNLLVEPTSMWLERLPAELRQIEQKVSIFKDSIENVQETTQKFEDVASIAEDKQQAQQVVVKGPNMLYMLLDGTQSFLLGVLSFLVLLFFLLAFGNSLAHSTNQLFSSRRERVAMLSIARAVRQQISSYLLLVTVINVGLGILVTLLMWALGMPNPLVWGASAAILNFIPYVGPAINLGIVALVALLTFDSPAQILLPVFGLLALNVVEGQFIQPLFVGKVFTISPILVFFSVLGWGWLWGIAGIFMAVPLLMIGKIVWDQSQEREAT